MKEKLEAKLKELKEKRNQFVVQMDLQFTEANRQLAGFNGAITVIEELLKTLEPSQPAETPEQTPAPAVEPQASEAKENPQ